MTSRLALFAAPLLAVFAATACSVESAGSDGASGDEGAPGPSTRCEDPNVQCQEYGRKDYRNRPPAYELGTDEKPATLTTIFQGEDKRHQPIDLEWNPAIKDELWITNYASSSLTILRKAGTPEQTVEMRRDAAYSHFMLYPPAFAWGSVSRQWGQQFGTCGNGNNGGNDFMGPSLYSSSMDLFGYQTEGGLGTHLDMLHSTPFCRGIAWGGTGNVYFTFNAQSGSIERYDFRNDHGPGADDHSDGVIHRYLTGQVRGVDNVMSHLSYNLDDRRLYVADTGNQRLLVMDVARTTTGQDFPGLEPIRERKLAQAPTQILAEGGELVAPSGLEATGGVAFVTDAKTSKVLAYSLTDGKLLRALDTGLPELSLAGLAFGPEGKIYLVDRRQNRVLRVDP